MSTTVVNSVSSKYAGFQRLTSGSRVSHEWLTSGSRVAHEWLTSGSRLQHDMVCICASHIWSADFLPGQKPDGNSYASPPVSTSAALHLADSSFDGHGSLSRRRGPARCEAKGGLRYMCIYICVYIYIYIYIYIYKYMYTYDIYIYIYIYCAYHTSYNNTL